MNLERSENYRGAFLILTNFWYNKARKYILTLNSIYVNLAY